MNSMRHTILGLFFFGALFALGFFTIYLGDFRFYAEHQVPAYFSRVDGLRVGDPVVIYGMPSGKVRSIEFTGSAAPEQRLKVVLSLDRPADFRTTYRAAIMDQSLLGGKRVELELGEGEPVEPPLQGSSPGGPLRSLEEFVSKNEADVQRITRSLGDILESVATGERSVAGYLLDPAAHADLQRSLTAVRNVVEKVDRGEGSLAALVNDRAVHDNLRDFLASGGDVLRQVSEGQGTLGRLVQDPEMYEDLKATSASARELLARVDRGEGMLGKLFSPESDVLFEDARSVLQSWDQVSGDLARGRGVLGRLVTDEELADEVAALVASFSATGGDLSALVGDVRRGRGVIGYLVADDEARRRLVQFVDTITGAVEDVREAAPVSSVGSFLFGQL